MRALIAVTLVLVAGFPLRAQKRGYNFSAWPPTRPVYVGTTAPSTCTVGDLFFDSDATVGQNLYGCTSTNTWTTLGDGTGAGSFGETSLAGLVNSQTIWDSSQANRTLTAGLSGATDPVITFSDSTINVTTGGLQVGGVGVLLAGSSTVGQVPRITGANTYAWGALDLADTDAVTGVLAAANVDTAIARLASPSFTTPTLGTASATAITFGADPADAGALRCSNNAVCLASEIATPGTDMTLTPNSSDQWAFSHAVVAPSFVGTSGSVAGALQLTQGTATTADANSVRIIAPTGITTAYRWIMPTGVGATGVVKGSVSSNDATLSLAAIADADVPDTITASNYMPLAGGAFTAPVTAFSNATPTTDAAGEFAFDSDAWGASRGAVQVYDGTANVWLVGILASDTCSNGEVAKFNTGGTWTCEADATGGTAAWDTLTAPTGAVSLVSNGTSETVTVDFQAAFTTGSQFVVKSSTGNPSGGVLAEVLGHDADVTLLKITNGGSNGVQVSAAGALTAIGTGAITATGPAASDTVAGIVELATAAETTTGTDAARAVTPDGLAGSATFGTKVVEIEIFPAGTAATTGDGKAYFIVTAALNGMNLVGARANVYTAGTTGTINIDLARCAAAATGNVCSGTVADMLSTNITIDSGENDTATAATAAVIDTANDDVATGQIIRVDVDAIHTTPSQGAIVALTFQLP